MKLLIKRDEHKDIQVQVEINGNKKDFDYIDFVDNIYNEQKIDTTDFDETINDWEKTALKSIITKIDNIVSSKTEDEVEEANLDDIEFQEKNDYAEIF